MGRNQFWGHANGASTKAECGVDKLSNAEPLPVPVQRNAWILTGKQPNGKFLTVLALDGFKDKTNDPIQLSELDPVSQKTFVVRSGSTVGIHVYFYTATEIHATQCSPSKYPKVMEVDRRGQGGKIYAPGSQFEGQPARYEIMNDVPILEITDAEFWRIWNIYAERDDSVLVKEFKTKQTTARSGSIPKLSYPAKPATGFRTINPSFPPCMNNILFKLVNGEISRNHENFTLWQYFKVTKIPKADVLIFIRNRPDEKVLLPGHVQKSVENMIRDLNYVYNRNDYTKCRSCSTMYQLNLCPGICSSTIRNPAQYTTELTNHDKRH